MPQELYSRVLPNGLTLLAEQMPHVRSAIFTLMTPGGAVFDGASVPSARMGFSKSSKWMARRSAASPTRQDVDLY